MSLRTFRASPERSHHFIDFIVWHIWACFWLSWNKSRWSSLQIRSTNVWKLLQFKIQDEGILKSKTFSDFGPMEWYMSRVSTIFLSPWQTESRAAIFLALGVSALISLVPDCKWMNHRPFADISYFSTDCYDWTPGFRLQCHRLWKCWGENGSVGFKSERNSLFLGSEKCILKTWWELYHWWNKDWMKLWSRNFSSHSDSFVCSIRT